MDELKEDALDALITAVLILYIEDGRKIPAPSELQTGDMAVDLPASVVAKVLLLNTMVQAHIRTRADLARKMHIKPQEVTRITDIKHSTKNRHIAKRI